MDVIKNYRRQLKDHGIPEGSMQTFAKLGAEKRAKLKLFDDPKKIATMEAVLNAMPVVECKAEAYTEGETNITMSDAITLKFTITYTQLAEKEAPGYVHAEAYPFLKRQNWYIIVTDAATKEMVIMIAKLAFEDKEREDCNTATLEMRQRFGKAGSFAFHVRFMCDCYMGFDKEIEMSFEVKEDDPTRAIPEYHIEDIESEKGPSAVE